MSSVTVFSTTDYVVDCVTELLHYGRLEVITAKPSQPEQRVALSVRVMNVYNVDGVVHYDISFRNFLVHSVGDYGPPMWLVIPLKVYRLNRSQVERILHHYLYESDAEMHPEQWGLDFNTWGYSSERAMMKIWDMIREVHHHNGSYPHHLTYCMTSLTGDAIVDIEIDSPTNRKAQARATVEIKELKGYFPVSGTQRTFRISEGELGSFSDLFDGPVLLNVERIH